jgi:hypothetical protein
MKETIFLFALAVSLAVGSPVSAKSLVWEITPTNAEAAGFTVAITHERLVDGTVKFRVVISEKEATFSSKPSTALSTVKNSSSIPGGRALPSERQGHSIVCVFTVTKDSLEDPDFCFLFTNYVERVVDGKLISMPSADFVYARLKAFAH